VDIGIQDDGHTPTGPASPRGHGLGNMASRAVSIGARLSVERNDQGTLVRLTLPVPVPVSATAMPV
jgi:signal transduction histidine kinase